MGENSTDTITTAGAGHGNLTEAAWLASMKPDERRAFALLRECRLVSTVELFRAA